MLSALCSAMVLAGGCIYDFDSCAATEDREDVKLRFTVVTRASYGPGMRKTRAADIDGEQPGSAPENYLNLAGRDIRFLLFDGEQKLLREFTPDADITVADGDKYITYTVRATIAEPYFANVATAATDFYIMVIANCRPYSPSAFGLAPGATTIADVADQLASFTMKTTETGGTFGWKPLRPGDADGEYIPMAGLQHFTLLQGELEGNGPENFVDLSGDRGKDINMLRALAKIEIIDRIDVTGNFDKKEDKTRINVEKAELFGRFTTGTILPSYNQWNRNDVLETQQVTGPTIASTLDYIPPTGDIEQPEWTSLIEFHEDKEATRRRADGCPVFSAYVTEYSRTAINGKLPPFVRITVKDPTGSKFYRMELAEYKDGKPGKNLDALLRNHIYRYEIVSVSQPDEPGEPGKLDIYWTICPMSPDPTIPMDKPDDVDIEFH